jgi:hypothetical protein
MAVFYNVVNNASAIITSPHTIGDGILHVNPIGIFGSGGFPIRVTCVRQSDNATVIYSIGNSGATTLNITGVLENTADIDLAVNDICQSAITAGAFKDIHNAIHAIDASGGSSIIGTSGAIAIFAGTGLIEDNSFVYDRVNKRLGIGVITPGAKLQVDTSAAATKGLIVKGFTSQTANLFEAQNSSSSALVWISANGTINSNAGASMAIDLTSSALPAAQIRSNDSTSSRIRFQASPTANFFEFWKDGTPTKGMSIGMSSPSDTITDHIIFSTFNGTAWSEAMRILSSGNVGIGKKTPLQRLDVDGPLQASGIYTGIKSVLTNYTISNNGDDMVLVDSTSFSPTVITLLNATTIGNGREFTIKKTDASANIVAVSGVSGQTIDGSAVKEIVNQWDSLTIKSFGGNWYIK